MNDRSIRKHIIIIDLVEIAVVLAMMLYTISESQYVGEIEFRYMYNQNTGEQLSVIASIFIYIFCWFVLGMVPFAVVFLVGLTVYFIIHRKDKNLLYRSYSPPYQVEFMAGGSFAFFSVFLSELILVFLHVSGLFYIAYPF